MSDVPRKFRESIADYNRHCWIAAFLSLLGAVFGWAVVLTAYMGGALFFDVIGTMDPSQLRAPRWFFPAGAGLVAVLFLLAAFNRWRRRYRPVTDRAIVGWHLVGEVLFAPARMTFAIWDHMAARVSLTPWELGEAWWLLQVIVEKRRATISGLGYDFPDAELLSKLLLALQLAGWIDLHHGTDDWFYTVRSDAEPDLRLLQDEDPAKDI